MQRIVLFLWLRARNFEKLKTKPRLVTDITWIFSHQYGIFSRGGIDLGTENSTPYGFLVPSKAFEKIVCALTQLLLPIGLSCVSLSAVMCSITAFHNKMFLSKSVFNNANMP